MKCSSPNELCRACQAEAHRVLYFIDNRRIVTAPLCDKHMAYYQRIIKHHFATEEEALAELTMWRLLDD